MNIEKLKNIRINDFEYLFKQQYAQLCKYALKYIKNESLAEEIVQDVFFKIWEKRNSVIIKISIKSYLFTAVRNNCLKHIKHQKIVSEYNKYTGNFSERNTNGLPESLIYEETFEIIKDVLEILPERCSQIFKLSRFEGLKYHEIADKLKISVKTVEANISKALKIFRLYFPDYK